MATSQEAVVGVIDPSRGDGVVIAFLGGLLLGTLAGAALALFAAPQSGEELRGQFRDTSLQLTERASTTAGQLRDQASTLQERAQGALDQAKERAQALTGMAKDQPQTPPAGLDPATELAESPS